AERMFQLAERSSGTLLELGEEWKVTTETQARTTERALVEVSRRYAELRRAGGDRPQVLEGTARVLTSLAEVSLTLGDAGKARGHATDAIALYQQLRAGRDEERDRAGEAAARDQLAQALLFQGQLERGAGEHRQAQAIRQALVKASPKNATYA